MSNVDPNTLIKINNLVDCLIGFESANSHRWLKLYLKNQLLDNMYITIHYNLLIDGCKYYTNIYNYVDATTQKTTSIMFVYDYDQDDENNIRYHVGVYSKSLNKDDIKQFIKNHCYLLTINIASIDLINRSYMGNQLNDVFKTIKCFLTELSNEKC